MYGDVRRMPCYKYVPAGCEGGSTATPVEATCEYDVYNVGNNGGAT